MKQIRDFAVAAKGMSRSPLGIIALFLVLVYAVASMVISFAKPDLFQHPWHPVVLFLATFPVVVLLTFSFLVARHHQKLYPPHEYKNQEHFFRTFQVPEGLATSARGVATSDRVNVPTTPDVEQVVSASYRKIVDAGYCLIHDTEVLQTRTSPGSGRYRVRVWIEAFGKNGLGEVASVTYRVWDDFPNHTLTTTNSSSNFDLWLNVYGEFPVLALLTMRDGKSVELERYIDLPGRPPD